MADLAQRFKDRTLRLSKLVLATSMEATRKLIARKMFRLRVYEAKGIEYQHLFEKVMQYRHSGFVPIKPYGNVGDRKNDGYIPTTGTYFQVYAPEDPSNTRSLVNAATKVKEDFEGLVANWNETTRIRVFRFVFNDGYRGSPAPVQQAIVAISHTVEEASVFLAKDLEAEALELAEDQLVDIINTPIPESGPMADVDFGVLREVIHHILRMPAPLSPTSLLQAPDFDDKIKFNGLSKAVGNLLTVGSYQAEAVEDYFSKNSTFARQQVRDELASMYAESRARIDAATTGEAEGRGDLVFFDLLERVTPSKDEVILPQRVALQASAIILMAFYFEACDIFEDPSAVT
jgi:hypothetical protein